MKYHQQVSVDFVNMVYTAIAYLALAGAAWLFLRLIQACFWLPSHMKRQNDVQRMLQEKVDSYESYIAECEAKEDAGEIKDDGDNRSLEEKRKERRECLEMLKRELQRIRDGGDPYDFDHLLGEEERKLMSECEKELDDSEERVPLRNCDNMNENAEETEKEIVDEKIELRVNSEPKKTK